MARSTTWRRISAATGEATDTQAYLLFLINEGETLSRLRVRAILNSASGDELFALQAPLWVWGIYAYDNSQEDESWDVVDNPDVDWMWWASMHCETYAYDLDFNGGQISFERCYTVPEEVDIKAQRGPAGPDGLSVYWQARPLNASGAGGPNSFLQVTASALILDPVSAI